MEHVQPERPRVIANRELGSEVIECLAKVLFDQPEVRAKVSRKKNRDFRGLTSPNPQPEFEPSCHASGVVRKSSPLDSATPLSPRNGVRPLVLPRSRPMIRRDQNLTIR